MNRYSNILNYAIVTITVSLLFIGHIAYSQTLREGGRTEKEPDVAISVTLSVYSGRPNPQWWIVPSDQEYKKLFDLIKALKTEEKALFAYDEWNRLGHATFWLDFKNVGGMPYAIHIWRDMAYIVKDKKGKISYAVGAMNIYDMLVPQAEKGDQKRFFINYHKFKEERKTHE
jgi:hypothetical protein